MLAPAGRDGFRAAAFDSYEGHVVPGHEVVHGDPRVVIGVRVFGRGERVKPHPGGRVVVVLILVLAVVPVALATGSVGSGQ